MKLLLAALLALAPLTGAPAQAVGEKDAAELGRNIAQAFNKRDAAAFMKMMDVDAFGHIVLDDLGLAAADSDAIRKRLPVSVRSNIDISMRAIDKNQGTAKFVRAGSQDGKAFALVRMDLGDQGVDYVRYYASSPRAVSDWYVFTAASLFSTQVRFNLVTIFKNDSMLYRLFGMNALTAADAKPFAELREHVQKQDYASAYRALEKFPESYRKSRQWALMRVTYGGRTNDDAYRDALRYLAEHFGSEPELQLVLLDHYFYEKRYDRALAAVDQLERAIGGEDGSSNSLRGNLFTAWKRHDEAAKACRRAMAIEPDYKQAYWCLVTVALERNDGKLAVEGLTAYEKAFGVRFDPARLAEQESYKEISRTREFADWAKAHRR